MDQIIQTKKSGKTFCGLLLIIVILVLIYFFSILSPSNSSTKSNNIKPTDSSAQNYEIIRTNDISFGSCKRVTFKIVVADNASKDETESIMQKIIDDNKNEWQDITVWAYKLSEKNTEAIGWSYTKGMKEFSTCK